MFWGIYRIWEVRLAFPIRKLYKQSNFNSKTIKNLGTYRKREKWALYFKIKKYSKKCAHFLVLHTTAFLEIFKGSFSSLFRTSSLFDLKYSLADFLKNYSTFFGEMAGKKN